MLTMQEVTAQHNTNFGGRMMENTKKEMTTVHSNWMIGAAGFLFWGLVICKIALMNNNMLDAAFTTIFDHAMTLIGVLAFFGIRREQKIIAKRLDEEEIQ